MTEIRDLTAWERGRDLRIKMNAWKRRRRELDAALAAPEDAEFRAWLLAECPPALRPLLDACQAETDAQNGDFGDERSPAARAYDRAWREWWRRVGARPEFLREALDQWGGLTERQLSAARKIFAERTQRSARREEEETARRQNAQRWTAGRQQVTGEVLSTRWEDASYGHHQRSVMKAMVQTADGRKLWTTLPVRCWIGGEAPVRGATVTLTVTVAPSDDDPTMAFGKNPR